jgi:hypothetical protein
MQLGLKRVKKQQKRERRQKIAKTDALIKAAQINAIV